MIFSTVKLSQVLQTVRYITLLVMGKKIVRTPKQLTPYGFDSNPIENMIAIYAPTSNSDSTGVVIGYINKRCIADIGESRIFSTDASGNFKTNLLCGNDGKIYMGNSEIKTDYIDFLVKYNEFKTWHDNYYLLHTHPTAAGESGTPTIISDVTNTKTANILID